MQWLLDTLLVPLIVAVVGAAIIGAFNWRRIRNWAKAREMLPAEGTHFTVLVSQLDGDQDGKQTDHVVQSLAGASGIKILRDGRCLKVEEIGDIADNEASALAKGRVWLSDKHADLLVWGKVVEENKVLRLRFLPGEAAGSGEAKGYVLNDVYELPKNFETDFADALLAVALSAAAPAFERAGQYVVPLLEAAATKLDRLLKSPPASLTPNNLASIHHAFAVAAGVLGEQSGDSKRLEEAVAAFRAALEVYTRERVPLVWATAQNNLANALSTLGAREEGTARLEEAVTAYRAALEERSRERVPLDWATTRNNGPIQEKWRRPTPFALLLPRI